MDPRTDITHAIQVGQVYTDSRTDTSLTLCYKDEAAVLLRDEDSNAHRLEPARQFEENVGADRYTLSGDGAAVGESYTPNYEEVEFTSVSGIGDTTASSLRSNGYTTKQDILAADDDTLLDEVRGLGEGNLANLYDELD